MEIHQFGGQVVDVDGAVGLTVVFCFASICADVPLSLKNHLF